MKRARRLAIALFTLAALSYAGLCAWIYATQRSLLFQPERNTQAPAAYGLTDFQEITLTAKDGVRLAAWRKDARPGMPTIVYFHGNGGHMGYRKRIYAELVNAGFGLLALDYRGYGNSEGTPTENGLYADARAAIAYATGEMGVPVPRLIFFGESLGTQIAVTMATEYTVGMVVLESPFTSIRARAQELFYYLPVRLLLKDTFDSLTRIPHVTSPLLVLHGERDITVPIAHGKALFAAANAPKHSVYYPNVAHNDFDPPSVVKEVVSFAKTQGLTP